MKKIILSLVIIVASQCTIQSQSMCQMGCDLVNSRNMEGARIRKGHCEFQCDESKSSHVDWLEKLECWLTGSSKCEESEAEFAAWCKDICNCIFEQEAQTYLDMYTECLENCTG